VTFTKGRSDKKDERTDKHEEWDKAMGLRAGGREGDKGIKRIKEKSRW
jgi:hypothetical protein